MSEQLSTQEFRQTSVKKIAVASVASLGIAVFVFVGAVLPAEYGVDPLGTGDALGLLALSQVAAISAETSEYKRDFAELKLRPSEWAEYTYRLEEGATMLYSWTASGVVAYNFHSAPDGAPPGYAESFDAQESDSAHGTYSAPFTGVHGWYWENLGQEEVTILLSTTGFYRDAHEARDRVDGYHSLMDIHGESLQDGSK